MSKGNKSRPKNRKRLPNAKRPAEKSKNRVLETKCTNENDNKTIKSVASPTTPVCLVDDLQLNSNTIENWPTTYLENGDFFVETIRSAATSELQRTGTVSDTDRGSEAVSDEFRHYDVLDELLCEQVDPTFSLVPTPKSRAASVMVTKSANNSFDWEASDKEKIQASWSEVVLETQSKLYSAYAKIYAGFWTGVVQFSLRTSLWTNKLQNTPRYSRSHPYNALFIFSFTATFAPVAIVFVSVMSIISIFLLLFYVGVFLSVSAVAAMLVVPLMGLSLSFAATVMICGFFSNAFFRLAQVIYGSYSAYSKRSLRLAADQIPPSVGTMETTGESRSEAMLSKIPKFPRKKVSSPLRPIVISGAEVPNRNIDLQVA
ncbi:LAME_0A00980g1_1 [Lachancea meyersii CBS 8951]|uniref:LAME_0A00980g1_1 n=1 Tax=Lachancea meyersii CBS 8951 TaxID=1266667 RepID=A0A1G4ILJ3_9SACH|nr:LAME_0A00980g1_1 [Lachancea meyersii CBS 8951]